MSSKIFRTMLGLTLGVTLFASAAQAQPADKRTYFTFSGPIALPGTTLPAGRYVFRIVDTETSRKVIQVLSDDEKKPYAMMNTIPDQRRDPAKDATVSFYETPAGAPAAVKSWWYPGESIGYQFIYPRAQARQIAKNTGKAILTTKGDTAKNEETKSGDLTRIDANGRDVDVNAPDAAASASASATNNNSSNGSNSNRGVGTSGSAVASSNGSNGSGFRDQSANSTVFNRNTPSVTEGVNRTPPQNAQNNSSSNQSNSSANRNDQPQNSSSRVARNELPKTASTLPLVGLIGMISALGFVTLRFGTSLRF